MKKLLCVLGLVAVLVSLIFIIPVTASARDKGPSARVAARITGRNGVPSEEFILKGNVYKDEAKNIFNLMNREREARGLSALDWDDSNYDVSLQRAFEISQHFAHERPDGRAVSTISYRFAGENLGTGPDGTDGAKVIMRAWMESDGHRSNILRSEYQSVAIGCVELDEQVYWVQIFSTQPPVASVDIAD